jgi:hypothetical protein
VVKRHQTKRRQSTGANPFSNVIKGPKDSFGTDMLEEELKEESCGDEEIQM